MGRVASSSPRGPAIPERLALGTVDAREIVFGDDHACILGTDDHVRCWGDGSRPQLGTGGYVDTDLPITVEGLDDVVGLVALKNTSGTCAVTAAGEVWCWLLMMSDIGVAGIAQEVRGQPPGAVLVELPRGRAVPVRPP